MIMDFGDKLTENLFHGESTRETRRLPADVLRATLRKLDMIHAAVELTDLKVPPGNRLEKLKGNLQELYSIRVNNQYRIVFQWHEQSAHHVQFKDYHI